MLKNIKCPSCGATYNPARIQCEYCQSYIIMNEEKYIDFNNIKFDTDNEKNNGIYVYGTLLGKGEIPISLGMANFYSTAFSSVGGKLLLTNKSLSFSSHTLLQKKTNTVIQLKDIKDVIVKSNLIISQQIAVTTADREYVFVVYNGKKWVEQIFEALKNLEEEKDIENTQQNNYIEELRNLKNLLDEGIITQEEFDIKKRLLLNI